MRSKVQEAKQEKLLKSLSQASLTIQPAFGCLTFLPYRLVISTEGALRLFMTIPTQPNPIPSIHI